MFIILTEVWSISGGGMATSKKLVNLLAVETFSPYGKFGEHTNTTLVKMRRASSYFKVLESMEQIQAMIEQKLPEIIPAENRFELMDLDE